MSSPHGSEASRARTSASLSASTTSSAEWPSPSPTGPPRTMNPSSTSSSMNAACASQPSCSRRRRDSFQLGPCARFTRKYMSVIDALEIEGVGRRRRAGFAAGTGVEQRRDRAGVHLDHRAYERADHVAQEAVGRDLELERVAAPVPLRTQHVSPENGV